MIKFRKLAIDIARLAYQKKCKNIVILDVRKLTSICDYFVIITITSDTQLNAVYDTIIKSYSSKLSLLSKTRDISPHWRVLDYVGVIVHLMMPTVRKFYSLERIWYKAKKIKFK
jgi:ribosome-associated protein